MDDKKPKWSGDDERGIDALVDIIIDSYLAMTPEQRKKWHEEHGDLPKNPSDKE
jgi:hypothetical protein